MDAETEFLNSSDSEVSIVYENGTEVYKLNKTLYGLKESPCAWYERFYDILTNFNFHRIKYDYCLHVKQGSITKALGNVKFTEMLNLKE